MKPQLRTTTAPSPPDNSQQPAPSPQAHRPRLHQPTQLRSPRHPRDIMTPTGASNPQSHVYAKGPQFRNSSTLRSARHERCRQEHVGPAGPSRRPAARHAQGAASRVRPRWTSPPHPRLPRPSGLQDRGRYRRMAPRKPPPSPSRRPDLALIVGASAHRLTDDNYDRMKRVAGVTVPTDVSALRFRSGTRSTLR